MRTYIWATIFYKYHVNDSIVSIIILSDVVYAEFRTFFLGQLSLYM